MPYDPIKTANTFGEARNDSDPIAYQEFAFDDLIEKQPGWLLYSGIPMLFGAVVLAIVLASFIKYPDKLPAPFLLTTENPPIDVVTSSGGQIAEWYVADRRRVAKNEALAYIDNPASLEDVESFAAFVEEVASIKYVADHRKLQAPADLQMGDMRQVYVNYVQTLSSFQYLLRQRIVFQKMNSLKNKNQKKAQLGKAMERRLALFEKELSLSEKDYRRNEQLNRDGVVSELDFEKIEAQLLQKQQERENLKSSIIQNKIEIEEINTQRMELQDARANEVADYIVKLNELSLQFRNEYKQWQKKYLVSAPIAGTVSIMPGMVEKRTVSAGDIIAGIIPQDAGDKIVARLSPPASGIGKIEVGNRVFLQLDAYPHKEFGVVETTITEVSLLPIPDKDGGLVYEVSCELPQPLTSATGKELPFRQKLTGVAQIITKDKSILKRLFERLLAVQQ